LELSSWPRSAWPDEIIAKEIEAALDPADECCLANVACWPILLKKSVGAAEPIFSASLVRFYNNDAEDRLAEPRRDVGRSQ
jgi:hypothetical protein